MFRDISIKRSCKEGLPEHTSFILVGISLCAAAVTSLFKYAPLLSRAVISLFFPERACLSTIVSCSAAEALARSFWALSSSFWRTAAALLSLCLSIVASCFATASISSAFASCRFASLSSTPFRSSFFARASCSRWLTISSRVSSSTPIFSRRSSACAFSASFSSAALERAPSVSSTARSESATSALSLRMASSDSALELSSFDAASKGSWLLTRSLSAPPTHHQLRVSLSYARGFPSGALNISSDVIVL